MRVMIFYSMKRNNYLLVDQWMREVEFLGHSDLFFIRKRIIPSTFVYVGEYQ